MTEKIKELRTMLPIPIIEAKQMLTEHNGDVETCVLLYVAKALRIITDATGASKDVAERHYRAENFDINRAIMTIKDDIYDANYLPIQGIDKNSLQRVKDWLYLMESNDFFVSLSYQKFEGIIATMLLIPELKEIGVLLQEVKSSYDKIFEGYHDDLPMDDFVRRNRELDEVPAFQEAYRVIPSKVLFIKNEIEKHWRNV